MACSLIQHKRINTTVAKAKALRGYVEPLMTKSKTDSTHSRRTVFSYLQNKEVVTELFREVAPRIAEREGGYTRIIRTGYRLGDNAEMCMIELVDFNEIYTNEKAKKTTRRSRRGGKKEEGEATVVDAVETTTEDAAPAVEAEVLEEAEVVAEAEVVEETPATEEAPAAEETSSDEPEADATSTEEAPEEK
jgi:large subunit ribosomal protein L17